MKDLYRLSVPLAGGSLPDEILIMPEGEHEIWAAANGKPERLIVKVDASIYPAFKRDFDKKLQSNVRPVFYYDHIRGAAAVHPSAIHYRNGVGLTITPEWTGSGSKNILERNYGYTSPNFMYDRRTQRPTGFPENSAEIASFTNEPAFETITRVAASKNQEPLDNDDNHSESSKIETTTKTAGQEPSNPNQQTTIMYDLFIQQGIMTKEQAESDQAASIAASYFSQQKAKDTEIANLKATKDALEQEKNDIKAKVTASAAELEETKKKLTDAEAQVTASKTAFDEAKAAKEALIESTIAAAVQAGKIAPQDEATQSALRDTLSVNITAGRKIIEGMQPNPAFINVVAGKSPATSTDEATGRDRMIATLTP